jgi:hypothetical protein
MNILKASLILSLLLPYSITEAKESYYCDKLEGLTTPLNEKSKIWELMRPIHNGVETTETISGFKIVIDGNNSYIQNENSEDKTPLLLFYNSDEKAELLEPGSVASSLWTLDKTKKQIYQAKNGLLENKFKPLLNITQGYQMILKGNCR